MIPLYDNTPRGRFPFINYLFIGLNILVFFLQLSASNFERTVYEYGFIPAEFNPLILQSYIYIFSSMFMHGGFLHIISNMLFLHIFGDNIEDKFGHIKYLLFYLAAGFISVMSQYFIATESTIPMIGASGAVAGIAGAYFVLFRHSKVKTLIIFFGFLSVVDISAGVVLGYWFLAQILSSIGSLTVIQQGGVAFFAHIGGFLFGNFIAQSYRDKRPITS